MTRSSPCGQLLSVSRLPVPSDSGGRGGPQTLRPLSHRNRFPPCRAPLSLADHSLFLFSQPILRSCMLPPTPTPTTSPVLGNSYWWIRSPHRRKSMGLAPRGKADNKVALDAAAWVFNIVTSVGIIMVNKALMATHGFRFATTLPGFHFATTALSTLVMKWLGYVEPSCLPLSELIKFVFFANVSVIGMNASLMWNSVGFYQISKLSMVPALCMLEVLFDNVRYSRDTKLSIMVVLVGVAVCTVTDVSVNTQGLIAAAVAVCSTAFQQHYIHYLQKKHSLNSFNLLSHTAPAQAASLLIFGPFVDLWLTNKRVDTYNYNKVIVFFIALSCVIAVGTNLSQFICIGRFTAVSFQVLGHMKTIFVLTLGFLLFGKEGLNLHVALGMVVAVVGMIWYGYASSRPGGKERQDYPDPVEKDIEQGILSSRLELDEKI